MKIYKLFTQNDRQYSFYDKYCKVNFIIKILYGKEFSITFLFDKHKYLISRVQFHRLCLGCITKEQGNLYILRININRSYYIYSKLCEINIDKEWPILLNS